MSEAPRVASVLEEDQIGEHRIALLQDGVETYPAMLEAIDGATKTICLETYIYHDDAIGERFAAALIERALAGVEVNLLYDAWGSSVGDDHLERLHAAGVRTVAFHRLGFRGRLGAFFSRLWRRDHRKILVVDSEVAFTGGLNIGLDYASIADGGQGWRDTHLRVIGPCARDLQHLFLRSWRRQGGEPVDATRYVQPSGVHDPRIRVVTSEFQARRRHIRKAYLRAVKKSRHRVWLTHGYFLPPYALRAALRRAAARGVDVRVILGGTTDVPAIVLASRAVHGSLLKAGVRLYEWNGPVLHAKTAVVDSLWATVGSSNLDARSLAINQEANVVVKDAAFAARMERVFLADLEHTTEARAEWWGQRSTAERVLSWIAYLFRDWL